MSIITRKRAVAYFDILGFKSKIDNMQLEELSDTYEKLIKHTVGLLNNKDGQFFWEQVCYRYIFSDSIFLISRDDSDDAFVEMISYAWRMMQVAIAMGLPLRGAITYGDIYANLESNVFLGKAIVDAAVLEGQQNWIGAVVDNSAIQRFGTVFEGKTIIADVVRHLLPEYDVPFKDGNRYKYCVLNWRQNLVSKLGVKALFKNEPFDESVQIKINLKYSCRPKQ